ncbi:MAG: ferredoxin [Nanoarchaeota archaeon]
MTKILHYRERCIGCATCVEHAPNQWELSKDDGKAILKNSLRKGETDILIIDKTEIEANEMAERDCPTRIIKIVN